MFEFWPQEPVTLRLPNGAVDGEPVYRDVAATAIVLWDEKAYPGLPPRTDARAELLLKSPVPPVAGGRIRWRNQEWDLGRVRFCQDLDGQRFCYRCALV